jgi:hypothetical protein
MDTDVHTYRLRLLERLDADFVAAFCPAGTTLTREREVTVLADVRTDQAGVLGLIRHLHNLGCTILALERSTGGMSANPSIIPEEER